MTIDKPVTSSSQISSPIPVKYPLAPPALEILGVRQKIFSYLSLKEESIYLSVCRTFSNVKELTSCWNGLKLPTQAMNSERLIIGWLGRTCPNIRLIDLTNSSFTDNGLFSLLKKCHKVKSIILSRTRNGINETSENAIAALKDLKDLWIGSCVFRPEFLEKLSQSLTIQTLHIGDGRFLRFAPPRNVPIDGPIQMTIEAMKSLEKFKNLFTLALHNVELPNTASHSLEIVSKRLDVLKITYCPTLLSFNFLKSCNNLTSVIIGAQPSFNDEAVFALSNCTKSLDTLLFEDVGITDASLAFIAQEMPQLRTFHLFDCNHVTESGLSVLSTSDSLMYLQISSDFLTNVSLAKLVKGLPNIQKITICSRKITRETLEVIQIILKDDFTIEYNGPNNIVKITKKTSISTPHGIKRSRV